MRKKKICQIGIIAMLLLLLMLGCTSDEGDRIFDEIVGEIGEPDELDNREDVAEQELTEDAEHLEIDEYSVCPDNLIAGGERPEMESPLSGHLTILTNEWDTFLPILADYFMEIHSGVMIEFERMEQITDIARQTALATRLLAEPPDIFNTAGLVFEKFSMDALFIDLNELIDGPGGVKRGDFFDNIFRGAEIEGNLYHLPLVISTETTLLNKHYFESIGVPIADKRMMTFDQYLDFYLQVVELYPEDDIYVGARFSVMDIFLIEQVYDVDNGTVQVDTPEMKARLELANSIPTGPLVEFRPDGFDKMISGVFGPGSAVDSSFLFPTTNFMYHWAVDLFAPYVFFIQDHPHMRFSHPVHIATETGEIRFVSQIAPAITSGSSNQELAWEFLRFCMEFSDSLYLGVRENIQRFYGLSASLPVNRLMFEDQLRIVLDESYRIMVDHNMIDDTSDSERNAQVEYAIYRFRELVEMLNSENRACEVVLRSLIYPDIYLFVTEQQDVDRTLENIQNRLEIYVAE